MKPCLLLLFLAAVTVGRPAYGQYLFLDVNGDGLNWMNPIEPGTGSDYLDPVITKIDVYFDTNHLMDGSAATCAQTAGNPLSMDSYEILLRAVEGEYGGSVTFNGWTDNVGFTTGMISAGDKKFYASGTEAWIGLGSSSYLQPGRYKVGTLNVTVSGNPVIYFLPRGASGISADAKTAFGTQCEGSDFDNTYKLGLDIHQAIGTSATVAVEGTTWGKIKERYH